MPVSMKHLFFAFSLVLLTACGAVHHRVVTPAGSEIALDSVRLAPVEVTSREQYPNALAVNEKWKSLAFEELRVMLAAKQIKIQSDAASIIRCRIEVVYGNRALRYFVGFGAGAGHLKIHLTLEGADGTPRYALDTEADLAVGVFGGSMDDVMRKALAKAASEFGSGF